MNLEVNRFIFDLDDYIVFKFGVEVIEEFYSCVGVVSCLICILVKVMVVVDESLEYNDIVVGFKSMSKEVCIICEGMVVGDRIRLIFRVGFDEIISYIGNFFVKFIGFFFLLIYDNISKGIEGVEIIEELWRVEF